MNEAVGSLLDQEWWPLPLSEQERGMQKEMMNNAEESPLSSKLRKCVFVEHNILHI